MKRILTISLVFIFFAVTYVSSQDSTPPLTQRQLIDMFRRDIFRNNPQRVLNDFVRVNKIAFLPTKSIVRRLNSNGVPSLITNELKHNFAERLVYRVCHFKRVGGSAEQFTMILNNEMANSKHRLTDQPGGLLRDKIFDSVLAPPDGPTPEDLARSPHIYYVLIMGEVTPQGGNRQTVTARLVFLAKGQPMENITQPLVIRNMTNSSTSQRQVAERIVDWSVRAVENEIR